MLIEIKTDPRVRGLFRLHDTHGFALVDSLGECRRQGMVPHWPAFFADARRAGWGFDRVAQTIRGAIADACWPASWEDVLAEVVAAVVA